VYLVDLFYFDILIKYLIRPRSILDVEGLFSLDETGERLLGLVQGVRLS
jgi:hypothetical protein